MAKLSQAEENLKEVPLTELVSKLNQLPNKVDIEKEFFEKQTDQKVLFEYTLAQAQESQARLSAVEVRLTKIQIDQEKILTKLDKVCQHLKLE